jgi:hypothetical protein
VVVPPDIEADAALHIVMVCKRDSNTCLATALCSRNSIIDLVWPANHMTTMWLLIAAAAENVTHNMTIMLA